MSTDLMVLTPEEIAALANEMGTSADELQGGGNYLPSLRVWGKDDDEAEDAPRLKGKMFVDGIEGYDEPIFVLPGTITFRPLTQAFQWTKYDKKEEKTVNRTRLIVNFKEEARDEKGTVRCGKPPSKELRDNEALQKLYEDVTLYRRLQGILSFKGKKQDGTEVEIKDLLAAVNLKGANFTPFDDELVKKLPKGSNLWDFGAKVSTTRHVNGQVTYWVFHFEPDFSEKLPLTRDIFDTIKGLKSQMDTLNKTIDTKYYDAINARQTDDAATAALKGAGVDFADDDMPF